MYQPETFYCLYESETNEHRFYKMLPTRYPRSSPYAISSFSMYKNSEAIAIAGKTSPTNGTKTEGK